MMPLVDRSYLDDGLLVLRGDNYTSQHWEGTSFLKLKTGLEVRPE